MNSAANACNLDIYYWLNKELPSLKSWSEIYSSYKKNIPGCDDGVFGEGYSEAITRLLSTQWNTVSILSDITSRDPEFRLFVLKHIDATTDFNDLEAIASHTECKTGSLCNELTMAARSILKQEGVFK